jgi:hypothetical protein|tara:strand:+ start:9839 stop:10024 length:186 start_codon:yes stop_codon:yes gene_type:complete
MGQSYYKIGSEVEMPKESKQWKDSSSVENAANVGAKAKRHAAWLRSTALGNQNQGGRPFGK